MARVIGARVGDLIYEHKAPWDSYKTRLLVPTAKPSSACTRGIGLYEKEDNDREIFDVDDLKSVQETYKIVEESKDFRVFKTICLLPALVIGIT